MKKLIVAAIVIPALLLAGLFAYSLYTGPRMTVQPHVRAFQTFVPLPPEGTVPVKASERLPSPDRAPLLRNPLSLNSDNLRRGSVYYRYYCGFCHGEQGGGNGPVGQSYMPIPADLRSPKFRSYRDGQLLRAMLTGVGHGPVLERVVPPEHRWYLVLYVRWLGTP